MKFFYLIVACVSVMGLFSSRGLANEVLLSSLPEAYMPSIGNFMEAVLSKSNDVKNRQLDERAVRGRLKVGKSLLMPDVSLNYIYRAEDDLNHLGGSYEEGDVVPAGQIANLSVRQRQIADLSVTQPLYHWGALSAEKKNYGYEYEIAQLNTRKQMRSLAREVRAGLLDLCLRRQSLEQTKAEHAAKVQALDLLKQRVEAGNESVQALEWKEVEIERSQLNIDQLERDFGYVVDGWERRLLLTKDVILEAVPLEVPKVEPLSEEVLASLGQLIEEALAANEDILINAINVEMSDNRLHVVSKRLFPKVNLTTGITQNERDVNGRLTDEELLYAGVSINWNVFDGFETDGLKEVARVDLERVRKTSVEYRSWFREEFRRMLDGVRREASYLRIDETLLLRYEKELSDSKDRFEDGQISSLDMGNAERAFNSRLLGVQRTRVRYLNSLTSLVSTVGLDPFVVVVENGLRPISDN